MNLSRYSVITASVLVLLAPLTGCDRLKARDQLNKGVQAYKAGHMEEATNHFQNAIQLDPTLPTAKLYLATAYSSQVTPNLNTPENMKAAQSAIDLYSEILAKDPRDTRSLKGIAALYLDINNTAKAKEYQQKVVAVDPNDAEAYYTIGVIDWKEAYNNAIAARNKLGQTDNGDPIKDKAACAALVAQNGPDVQEGLDALNKAVAIRKDYADAMAYLNLLYRRKAELECGDDAARKADTAQADDWVHKSIDAKKVEEAEKAKHESGGIAIDPDK